MNLVDSLEAVTRNEQGQQPWQVLRIGSDLHLQAIVISFNFINKIPRSAVNLVKKWQSI